MTSSTEQQDWNVREFTLQKVRILGLRLLGSELVIVGLGLRLELRSGLGLVIRVRITDRVRVRG